MDRTAHASALPYATRSSVEIIKTLSDVPSRGATKSSFPIRKSLVIFHTGRRVYLFLGQIPIEFRGSEIQRNDVTSEVTGGRFSVDEGSFMVPCGAGGGRNERNGGQPSRRELITGFRKACPPGCTRVRVYARTRRKRALPRALGRSFARTQGYFLVSSRVKFCLGGTPVKRQVADKQTVGAAAVISFFFP